MRFMSTRLIADLQCSKFVIINFHPATCLVACGTCWIFRWSLQFAATRATATPLGLKAMCWEMKTRRPIPSHVAGKWCRWWVDVKKSWVLAHHRCRVMLCFLFDIWMFLSSIWVCAIVHANGCHSAGLPTAIWYLPRLLLRQGQDVKIMLFGHGFIAWGEIIKHPGDRCWSYKWPCYARPSRATLGLTMRCVRFAMVYGGFHQPLHLGTGDRFGLWVEQDTSQPCSQGHREEGLDERKNDECIQDSQEFGERDSGHENISGHRVQVLFIRLWSDWRQLGESCSFGAGWFHTRGVS